MIYEKAYAKVNLALKVIGKRQDGYHDLEMVMASVDLFDELSFQESDETNVIMNNDGCKLEDNLIYKAILLIKKKFSINKDVLVTVNKNIPVGGGLGGGSSDAAATIRGLNNLWDLHLKYQDMYDIAVRLGSDVPFCLTGEVAFVKGRGEIIIPLKTNINARLVLVFPDYKSYTKEVFTDYGVETGEYNIKKLIEAIYQKDVNLIGKYLYNDLEEIVNKNAIRMNKVPISDIKALLLNEGCLGAVMSGSGATVIGILKNELSSSEIIKKLSQIYPDYKFKVVEIV